MYEKKIDTENWTTPHVCNFTFYVAADALGHFLVRANQLHEIKSDADSEWDSAY